MTLRAFLRTLRERALLVVVVILLSIGVAVAVTALSATTYQANTTLYVQSTQSSGIQSSRYDAQAAAQALVGTLTTVVKSDTVMTGVRQQLNLQLTNQQLSAKITATAPAASTLLEIHVTDASAGLAARIANSVAKQFLASQNTKKSTYSVSVVNAAIVPSSPVSPNPVLNISLGLLLGILLGAALAVARDALDNRVKTVERLAKVAGKPSMGVVVEDPNAVRHPIATRAGSRNVRAENFRQLRANLQFANVDEHPRVIAITSSIPSEGKTMVAMNLASTLAEAGFTVCLVDADLRRPTVAKVMGLAGPVGLTSVLIHQLDLTEALQSAGANLSVLSSGPTPPNPSEVLASSYVRDIIRSLLDKFDYVVIDTAPLLPVADGSEVAALADGTLLVARHKLTTDTQVRRAVDSLSRVDAKLLGVILNRVPNKRSGEYGYTYYRSESHLTAPSANGTSGSAPLSSRVRAEELDPSNPATSRSH